MVQQFTHHANDYLIWDHYDALDFPRAVPARRGVRPALRDTTAEMLTRGPESSRAGPGGGGAWLRPCARAQCAGALCAGGWLSWPGAF